MSIKLLKVVLFAAALVPAAWLARGVFHDQLGPNPVETITHTTGDWALRFLLLTLAVTPFRKLLKVPPLIRFRRMLGLFAFFYATLHFLTWAWLDRMFDPAEIIADVQKRPFITAGALAFVAMIPLAITSTAGWIRRLGGRHWRMLHRLVYVSAAAAVLHFYWLVKSDVREPLTYAAILLILLLARAFLRARSTRRDLVRGAPTESAASR
jgi:sulfoxide reductase heme-binding subunit YedZ